MLSEIHSANHSNPAMRCFPWNSPVFRQNFIKVPDELYPNNGLLGLLDAQPAHPFVTDLEEEDQKAFRDALTNFKTVTAHEREGFLNKHVMFKRGFKMLESIWVRFWTMANMNPIVDELLEQDELMIWQVYLNKDRVWPPQVSNPIEFRNPKYLLGNQPGEKLITVRDACAQFGPQLTLMIFGPAGLVRGTPTDHASEILKAMISWCWSRQKRSAIQRLKNKDKKQQIYDEATKALLNMKEDAPKATRLKVAKAAFDAAINFSKDLRLVEKYSQEGPDQVLETMRMAGDLIDAIKGTDQCKCFKSTRSKISLTWSDA